MAWMPVAEAAAVLGVSERTIWRRIKSGQVPSRSEAGRTLVTIDDPQGEDDPVRQLSHVAAAQLSMRKLDAETVSEVLATVADYRSSFDLEIRRARRSGRSWAALAVCLFAALGGGIWYHFDSVQRAEERHRKNLDGLVQAHGATVGDLRVEASRATGLAEARRSELDNLRAQQAEQVQLTGAVEASRDALQATIDQKLTALHQTSQAQQTTVASAQTEIERLNKMVVQLQARLHEQESEHQSVRRQSDRVTAAIRRSAARHAGVAEGLRLYVERQHAEVARLRTALASAQRMPTYGPPTDAQPAVTKETLWRNVVGEAKDPIYSEPEMGNWRGLLHSWLSVWWNGVDDSTPSRELAQAG